jgi:molecular chaperone GrpE (heat shock protein)
MNKIFVIIALVLLIVGSGMLGWNYLEKKKEQQRIVNIESKYDSETDEIIEQFGMEGYDKSIQSQLQQEQQDKLQAELASGEKELREFILTGSIVCISMGGTIFSWYFLLWLFRAIAKGVSVLRKYMPNTFRKQPKDDIEEPDEIYVEKDMIEQEQEQSPIEKESNDSRTLVKSKSEFSDIGSPLSTKRKNSSGKKDHGRTKKPVGISSDENVEEFAVLLSDEETSDSLAKLEDSLKAQTEQLEQRTAQSVQEALKEHSKPLDSTLKDLAQQVSAIREYASCQQERVEKLQNGYDWNIIRTFCLRIIRCIDNLENRIDRLSGKGTKTEYLEDIRDEMVFALESSGIEQYEPEINSNYRGQEKTAEAVKQKQHCENSKQKGKIAKVIRPGYQYIINEENIKIVRTAQVKLFG